MFCILSDNLKHFKTFRINYQSTFWSTVYETNSFQQHSLCTSAWISWCHVPCLHKAHLKVLMPLGDNIFQSFAALIFACMLCVLEVKLREFAHAQYSHSRSTSSLTQVDCWLDSTCQTVYQIVSWWSGWCLSTCSSKTMLWMLMLFNIFICHHFCVCFFLFWPCGNVTLFSQTSQLIAGQEQCGSPIYGDHGGLDGCDADLAL